MFGHYEQLISKGNHIKKVTMPIQDWNLLSGIWMDASQDHCGFVGPILARWMPLRFNSNRKHTLCFLMGTSGFFNLNFPLPPTSILTEKTKLRETTCFFLSWWGDTPFPHLDEFKSKKHCEIVIQSLTHKVGPKTGYVPQKFWIFIFWGEILGLFLGGKLFILHSVFS